MNPRTRSVVELNVAVLMWGGTSMFAKGISLPVVDIICVRSWVAAAALLLFIFATGKRVWLRSPRHLGVMVSLGLVLCAHWLTYFEALKVSTAAVAILSLHTYPVFTALIEPFLFREKLQKADVVIALAVFVGVVVMTPELSLGNSTTRGILLGIVSGLFFMTRNLITRRFVKEYSGSALMFWQTLITGVILLPVLASSASLPYSGKTIGLLILLGVVFTAVPQTLFSASLQHLSAKTVGILATLLPFYGALFGYFIHDERVTVRTAIGGLIIFACIIYETLKHTAKPAGDDVAQSPVDE